MRLTSSDGASLELRPTRYQFAADPEEPGDWDGNWLEVHGLVRTAAGGSWEFDDPCLTTWEARQLLEWLRAAAAGRVPVSEAPTEDPEGVLAFTEPNLAFSVAARDDESLVVRVHLALESVGGRPGADEDAACELDASIVPLRVGSEELLAAARAWEADLEPFPER